MRPWLGRLEQEGLDGRGGRREDPATLSERLTGPGRHGASTMALAETSATKTAAAAKLTALSTRADVADAEAQTAMADVDEAEAQVRYQDATDRAARRSNERTTD